MNAQSRRIGVHQDNVEAVIVEFDEQGNGRLTTGDLSPLPVRLDFDIVADAAALEGAGDTITKVADRTWVGFIEDTTGNAVLTFEGLEELILTRRENSIGMRPVVNGKNMGVRDTITIRPQPVQAGIPGGALGAVVIAGAVWWVFFRDGD